jgi:mRNA-degrading endonuclease RelE of RelBE toxin-antitoxin system
MAYRIEYDPEAEDHLAALTARDEATVLDVVPRQLAHQPTITTRNRKPMRPNPLAPWELRIGRLRVYYDVQEEPEPLVTIRAVGVKDRNRVRIGGTEITL